MNCTDMGGFVNFPFLGLFAWQADVASFGGENAVALASMATLAGEGGIKDGTCNDISAGKFGNPQDR